MRAIGFSTGAVALGDFRHAVSLLQELEVTAVELSALRPHELEPLLGALDDLDLSGFEYVAVHAPVGFSADEEEHIVRRLENIADRGWPIVVHPDSLFDYSRWMHLQHALCFENMDKRKPVGRTADELEILFRRFGDASLAFDIGHAHQVDRTMSEARMIVQKFGSRIRQIHVSEVNTFSRHVAVTASAKYAFRKVMDIISDEIPLIIESVVAETDIRREIDCVQSIFRQKVRQFLETD
jgi:hypothetical protein